ncbi:hypothetical protein CEUSTIGMA_g7658.t1 [Chlamydomonas eustigma]|uniref:VTC domain-containing protein n=1 Tax=Chlamydomonas eustigma TaxID=1157962 RepID=A0A250XBS7_9CHLO|nr:hypothetical protein CEUSTIGMA_g7658.t1 [Chlamydomonas eustigma]|eukprot:GAX80220.1 hypothetical protein CEUSTIGMA_g7658.t1 [Chlamydomonas eustigma]
MQIDIVDVPTAGYAICKLDERSAVHQKISSSWPFMTGGLPDDSPSSYRQHLQQETRRQSVSTWSKTANDLQQHHSITALEQINCTFWAVNVSQLKQLATDDRHALLEEHLPVVGLLMKPLSAPAQSEGLNNMNTLNMKLPLSAASSGPHEHPVAIHTTVHTVQVKQLLNDLAHQLQQGMSPDWNRSGFLQAYTAELMSVRRCCEASLKSLYTNVKRKVFEKRADVVSALSSSSSSIACDKTPLLDDHYGCLKKNSLADAPAGGHYAANPNNHVICHEEFLLSASKELVRVREYLVCCQDQLAEIGHWHDRAMGKEMKLKHKGSPPHNNLDTTTCRSNGHSSHRNGSAQTIIKAEVAKVVVEGGEMDAEAEESALQAAGLVMEATNATTLDSREEVQSNGWQHEQGTGCVEWAAPAPPMAKYRAQVEEVLLSGLQVRPETVLKLVSEGFEHLRSVRLMDGARKGEVGAEIIPGSHQVQCDTMWTPPDLFRRVTKKYWVRSVDLPRIQAEIIRHLPLLVYQQQQKKKTDSGGKASPSASSSVKDDESSTTRLDGTDSKMPVPASAALSSTATVNDQEATAPQLLPLSYCPSATAPQLLSGPPAVDAPITSVYFDNSSLDVYHSRLLRDDGASVVRVRWYGKLSPASGTGVLPWPTTTTADVADVADASSALLTAAAGASLQPLHAHKQVALHHQPKPPAVQKMYVERKCHREAWTGEFSLKERAAIDSTGLEALLRGTWISSPECTLRTKGARLLGEVQQYINDWGQVVLKQVLSSSSSSHGNDQSSQPAADLADFNVHSRNGQLQQTLVRACYFPYSIVEVKLEDEEACPEWLSELQSSNMMVEAPKFSKFLHGMALCYPHLLKNTPHWFVPHGLSAAAAAGKVHNDSRMLAGACFIMRPATIEEMAAASGGLDSIATDAVLPAVQQRLLSAVSPADPTAGLVLPAASTNTASCDAATNKAGVEVTPFFSAAAPLVSRLDCYSVLPLLSSTTHDNDCPQHNLSTHTLAPPISALYETNTMHYYGASRWESQCPPNQQVSQCKLVAEEALSVNSHHHFGSSSASSTTADNACLIKNSCTPPQSMATGSPCNTSSSHRAWFHGSSYCSSITSAAHTHSTSSMNSSTTNSPIAFILSLPSQRLKRSGSNTYGGNNRMGGIKHHTSVTRGLYRILRSRRGTSLALGRRRFVPLHYECSLMPPAFLWDQSVVTAESHGSSRESPPSLPLSPPTISPSGSSQYLHQALQPIHQEVAAPCCDPPQAKQHPSFHKLHMKPSFLHDDGSDVIQDKGTAAVLLTQIPAVPVVGDALVSASHHQSNNEVIQDNAAPTSVHLTPALRPAVSVREDDALVHSQQPHHDAMLITDSCHLPSPPTGGVVNGMKKCYELHDPSKSRSWLQRLLFWPPLRSGSSGGLQCTDMGAAAGRTSAAGGDSGGGGPGHVLERFWSSPGFLLGAAGRRKRNSVDKQQQQVADDMVMMEEGFVVSSATDKTAPATGLFIKDGSSRGESNGRGKQLRSLLHWWAPKNSAFCPNTADLTSRDRTPVPHVVPSGGLPQPLPPSLPSLVTFPRAPALLRTRVEPKTFFAAERTFLAWVNIAVLVMFTSLSLMSSTSSSSFMAGGAAASSNNGGLISPSSPLSESSYNNNNGSLGNQLSTALHNATGNATILGANGIHSTTSASNPLTWNPSPSSLCSGNSICRASQISGLVLAPVAMCMMVYALYMYRYRSKQILRRETARYDDQRGPVALVVLLLLVVVVSYTLQLRASSTA